MAEHAVTSEFERLDELYSASCKLDCASPLLRQWSSAQLIARLWTLHGPPRPYGFPGELARAGRTLYVLRHRGTGCLFVAAAGKSGPTLRCGAPPSGQLLVPSSPEELLLSQLFGAPEVEKAVSCRPLAEQLCSELARVSLQDWRRHYWDDGSDSVVRLALTATGRWQRHPAPLVESVEYLVGTLEAEGLEEVEARIWTARLAALLCGEAGRDGRLGEELLGRTRAVWRRFAAGFVASSEAARTVADQVEALLAPR